MQYLKWKQTTPYTCGPSSLMVANGEKHGISISEKRENYIWDMMIPGFLEKILSLTVGSPPAFLTKYSMSFYNNPVLTSYKKDYEKIKGKKRLKYKFGCFLHDWIGGLLIKKYHCFKKKKNEEQKVEDFFIVWNRNPEAYFLENIIIEDGVVHFILVRYNKETNKMVVMDPLPGTNTEYTEDEFRKEFKDRLFGYCILLE